ncbi:oligosaccharide flippase family protein [Aeromonas veronii]|uniref:oligosaccharide flippase family protein n=1 Tax=Aeromonas veronii TaxID=654 RepID=UPI002443F5DE|nr:oligosaccharide flippase family protein [Aeromonas veronii]
MKLRIIIVFIAQCLNFSLPLLTIPYLTRVLSVGYYGDMLYAISVSAYLLVIVDFGFNLYVGGEISRHRHDSKFVCHMFSNTMMAKLLISVALALIVVILTICVDTFKRNAILIYCSYLLVIGSVFFPIWLYQGFEKMHVASIVGALSKLILAICIFFLVKDDGDIVLATVIQSFHLLLSSIVSVFFVRAFLKFDFVAPTYSAILAIVKDSSKVFSGTFFISLYTLMTPIILGFFASSTELAMYGTADKLRLAILGVILLFGGVFYPRVTYLFKTDPQSAYDFIRKVIIYKFFAGVIIFIFLMLFGKKIITIYLGYGFLHVWSLILIMLPMVFIVPMSVVLSNYILLPLKKYKEYSLVPLLTASLHFLHLIPLSFYYKDIGASISILITEITSFLILLYLTYSKGYLKPLLSR